MMLFFLLFLAFYQETQAELNSSDLNQLKDYELYRLGAIHGAAELLAKRICPSYSKTMPRNEMHQCIEDYARKKRKSKESKEEAQAWKSGAANRFVRLHKVNVEKRHLPLDIMVLEGGYAGEFDNVSYSKMVKEERRGGGGYQGDDHVAHVSGLIEELNGEAKIFAVNPNELTNERIPEDTKNILSKVKAINWSGVITNNYTYKDRLDQSISRSLQHFRDHTKNAIVVFAMGNERQDPDKFMHEDTCLSPEMLNDSEFMKRCLYVVNLTETNILNFSTIHPEVLNDLDFAIKGGQQIGVDAATIRKNHQKSDLSKVPVVSCIGTNLLSIVAAENGSRKTKDMTGTSMAAPIVASVASIISANYPSFTPHQVQQCILRTTRKNFFIPKATPLPEYRYAVLDNGKNCSIQRADLTGDCLNPKSQFDPEKQAALDFDFAEVQAEGFFVTDKNEKRIYLH